MSSTWTPGSCGTRSNVGERRARFPPVTNASPLIFLSGSGYLELLRPEGGVVLVPEPVAREIRQYGADDPTARALATASWLRVVPAPPPPPLIQAWDLGEGETGVLTLAHLRPGTEAIVDDRLGRRCAAALGIPVRGTLGLVLAARRTGRIDAARPVVERLIQAGMYLSRPVVEEALALVGE